MNLLSPTFQQAGNRFCDVLDVLIQPRRDQTEGHILNEVDDFSEKLAALRDKNPKLGLRSDQLVHGDICPENIIYDLKDQSLALIDFGFMTCCGDARFDAATAAAFFDMTGENSSQQTEQLISQFARSLACPTSDLQLLLATYCLIAINAFGHKPGDELANWCVHQLNSAPICNVMLG